MNPTRSTSQTHQVEVRLADRAEEAAPYLPVARGKVHHLLLDANEGPLDAATLPEALAIDGECLRLYPSTGPLERSIAARFDLDPRQVLVTAGGDDAIARACHVALQPGRTLLLPSPTFEMIERSARLAGAECLPFPWLADPFPTELLLNAIDERTGMIAIVTPNNPTGLVAFSTDIARIATASPNALVLVDLAYTEFADTDLTSEALRFPNVVVIRTFSKALGLAGLRVGYALGSARVVHAMRAMGSPYPCAGLSLAAAERAWHDAPLRLPERIRKVRDERLRLQALLTSLGCFTWTSHGNFVLARFPDACGAHASLATCGIAVRRFPREHVLADCLRITCPGNEAAFARLCSALEHTLSTTTPLQGGTAWSARQL